MKNLRAILAVVALLGSSLAFSQSINSFNEAQMNGVSVTHSGNTLTLTIDPNATLVYNSQTLHIERVWGAYLLDFKPNPTLYAEGQDDSPWMFTYNPSSMGRYAGWETQQNFNGLAMNPGSTVTKSWTFDVLSGDIDSWGIDVFTTETIPGTTGNTGRFRPAPVPEPVTLVVMGGALAAAFARKRRRA